MVNCKSIKPIIKIIYFKKKNNTPTSQGDHIPGVWPPSWGAAQIPQSSRRTPKPMTPAPSSSGSPTEGAGLNQIASPSFLPDSRIVFFTDLAVEEFTYPGSLHKELYFWRVPGGGWGAGKLSTLLLRHLDLPQRREFLFQTKAGVPGFGLLIYVGAARILACQACLLKSALPAKSHTTRTAAKGTSFCLEASMRGLKVDF